MTTELRIVVGDVVHRGFRVDGDATLWSPESCNLDGAKSREVVAFEDFDAGKTDATGWRFCKRCFPHGGPTN